MDLSSLKAAEGSAHSDNFRRGRGHGSGNGKTAGKGHKGQKARLHGRLPLQHGKLPDDRLRQAGPALCRLRPGGLFPQPRPGGPLQRDRRPDRRLRDPGA